MSIEKQLQEMRAENQLLKDLATRQGFFKQFFKELGKKESGKPVHRTHYECFEWLNEKHRELFGEQKYTSYESFRRSYNHYLNTL
jgi:hypothetical protein